MNPEKKGFPEEGELLLCTVTKIFGHSVFVNIDECNRSGMIHISEISPGRIRNLRDYVVEGKKIVCVVIRINREKGHIDLSLRRVSEGQRRKKLESLKQEQKSEKLLEYIAKEIHKDPVQFHDTIIEKISKNYKSLSSFFSDIVTDSVSLNELGIEKESADKLISVIKEKMKPPKIIIAGKLSMQIYDSNGIEIIKEALKKIEDIGKDSVVVRYAGGGTYNITVTADDYKNAEKILKEVSDSAVEFIEKKEGIVSFKRVEN